MESEIYRKREKTMRAGWLIGTWAMIPSTISCVLGNSLVQQADLIRRAVETLLIFSSWVALRKINKLTDVQSIKRVEKINRSAVSIVMMISALLIEVILTIRQFNPISQGILWPGIVVSVGDLAVNLYFTQKTYRLIRADTNPIIDSHFKLYTTKSAMNLCVLLSLICSSIIENANTINVINIVATQILVVFILWTAIQTGFRNSKKANPVIETQLETINSENH